MRFSLNTSVGVAIALAASLAAGAAMAQDAKPARGDRALKMKERFAAADKNGDGKLTKDEAKAGMPFVYKHFDDIDKTHSGAVSMVDIAAFARERHAAKPGG